MSYIDRELKIMVGIICGFIIGVVVAGMISPQIFDNQFLIPISGVCIIGFPILLCTRPNIKSTFMVIIIIVICIVAMNFILDMQEKYQLYQTKESIKKSFKKHHQ